MTLICYLSSLVLLSLVGLAAVLTKRSNRAALNLIRFITIPVCGIGAGGSVLSLVQKTPMPMDLLWPLPVGAFHIGIDPLSNFFLLCIYVVSGLAALYGVGYLSGKYQQVHSLTPSVAFFNLLIASMILLVLARDAVLFLMAWETMTLVSFFLVTFDNQREEVRRAGIMYLVASHLGVVFLFLLFGLLAWASGSFSFSDLISSDALGATLANGCFLLALLGFGAKAGFWPLHIWLPEAHPAAPTHVSALMSGVMIKMGIYGLLRTLTFFGKPPVWWGIVVICIGIISGISGVLHALSQHDIKRLLAYHSVENIGIIALGIGLGLMGQGFNMPIMAFFGYAGAILHVLNHGIFKGLLFQGAGSVIHATGITTIDDLGGIYRRMPITGLTFFIGSIAITGLPPLNGFISEWLIYLGALRGAMALHPLGSVFAIVVLPALALIGGLAVACFIKAFGIIFQGEPRSEAAAAAHESNFSMQFAMLIGAAICIGLGVWGSGALRLITPAVQVVTKINAFSTNTSDSLDAITRTACVLFGVILLIGWLRASLLRHQTVAQDSTWGCGYARPSTRMQYTAASFAEPILIPFSAVLSLEIHHSGPEGHFPSSAYYESHRGDLAATRLLPPAFRRLIDFLFRLHSIQRGRVQLYLVYIFITLIVLLVWQLSTITLS